MDSTTLKQKTEVNTFFIHIFKCSKLLGSATSAQKTEADSFFIYLFKF